MSWPRSINEEMKLAAANAIAAIIGDDELHPDYIIPSVFNRKVGPIVAKEVSRAAHRTKVARRAPKAYANCRPRFLKTRGDASEEPIPRSHRNDHRDMADWTRRKGKRSRSACAGASAAGCRTTRSASF